MNWGAAPQNWETPVGDEKNRETNLGAFSTKKHWSRVCKDRMGRYERFKKMIFTWPNLNLEAAATQPLYI